MKEFILLLLLFNVSFIISQNHRVIYGDEKYMYHENLSGNFKQGYVLNKHLPDGKWTVYSKDKSNLILSEGIYLNNKKFGLWKYYNNKGNLRKTCEFKNGKITGTSQSFHKNGKLNLKIIHYTKHSFEFEFYDEKGKIHNKGQYSKDSKSGVWTEYYSDGKVKSTQKYKKGRKIGLQKHYN